jgi:hypothetical protein
LYRLASVKCVGLMACISFGAGTACGGNLVSNESAASASDAMATPDQEADAAQRQPTMAGGDPQGLDAVAEAPADAAAPGTMIDAMADQIAPGAMVDATPDQAVPGAIVDATADQGDGTSPGQTTTDGSPPADAFVNATLGASYDAMGNDLCPVADTTAAFTIGTSGMSPVRESDGTMQATGVVHVMCMVSTGFDVQAKAFLTGGAAGSIDITGLVGTNGTALSVQGSLATAYGTYSEGDCTIISTYRGDEVPATPTIALGRIWAHLSCPHMQSPDTVVAAGSAIGARAMRR